MEAYEMMMHQPLNEQDYEQIAKFLATPAYERRPKLLITEKATNHETTGEERPAEHK